MAESWIDPETGARCQRVALGKCFYGRLNLNLNRRLDVVDLLWCGAGLSGGFDYPLRKLIAGAWRTSRLPALRKVREPYLMPLSTKLGFWWVCALPVKRYFIESYPAGGAELFEIRLTPRFVRRDQPATTEPAQPILSSAITPALAAPTQRIVLRRPAA